MNTKDYILLNFESESSAKNAAQELKYLGIKVHEYHVSPDKSSSAKIGKFALASAILCIVFVAAFMWFTAAVDYKVNIGGMNYFNIIISSPVLFELCALAGVIGALGRFIAEANLPNESNGGFTFIYKSGSFYLKVFSEKTPEVIEINNKYSGVEI
ncbi:MAG: quinol:electron acceptor oxidoreductase subunit ActD [Candidatus Kapaibacterium sp.]